MMRIVAKRVNVVEKEIAKENRKETNEAQLEEGMGVDKEIVIGGRRRRKKKRSRKSRRGGAKRKSRKEKSYPVVHFYVRHLSSGD